MRAPTPTPYSVRTDVLTPAVVSDLLDYVRANEIRFAPATLRAGGEPAVNAAIRVSSLLRDLGPFHTTFETLLHALLPALAAELGEKPFAASRLELELVAHGDGAFFLRHMDTLWDRPSRSMRALSGVYYFHAIPKGFEGGALRLHTAEAGAQFVDLAPAHNSLVFFPSWLSHEVMPVRCPSGRFMDSRFAVSCWIWRPA